MIFGEKMRVQEILLPLSFALVIHRVLLVDYVIFMTMTPDLSPNFNEVSETFFVDKAQLRQLLQGTHDITLAYGPIIFVS